MQIEFSSRGFSLIEMISVIVTLGVLAAIGGTMLESGFNSYFKGEAYTASDWQARIALTRMNRELRNVRTATSADLTISPSTEITFVDGGGNSIRYFLSGTMLMRNTRPLADGISSLSFSYLERDGKTITTIVTDAYYIVAVFIVVYGNTNNVVRTVVHMRNVS